MVHDCFTACQAKQKYIICRWSIDDCRKVVSLILCGLSKTAVTFSHGCDKASDAGGPCPHTFPPRKFRKNMSPCGGPVRKWHRKIINIGDWILITRKMLPLWSREVLPEPFLVSVRTWLKTEPCGNVYSISTGLLLKLAEKTKVAMDAKERQVEQWEIHNSYCHTAVESRIREFSDDKLLRKFNSPLYLF